MFSWSHLSYSRPAPCLEKIIGAATLDRSDITKSVVDLRLPLAGRKAVSVTSHDRPTHPRCGETVDAVRSARGPEVRLAPELQEKGCDAGQCSPVQAARALLRDGSQIIAKRLR